MQSAVIDALAPYGVRHLDMPMTPEKVWRAMTAGGNGGNVPADHRSTSP